MNYVEDNPEDDAEDEADKGCFAITHFVCALGSKTGVRRRAPPGAATRAVKRTTYTYHPAANAMAAALAAATVRGALRADAVTAPVRRLLGRLPATDGARGWYSDRSGSRVSLADADVDNEERAAVAAAAALVHVPVMLDEVVRYVDPRPGKTIVDATFGVGGYTRRFLGKVADLAKEILMVRMLMCL